MNHFSNQNQKMMKRFAPATAATTTTTALSLTLAPTTDVHQRRTIKVRMEKYFSNEALPHARRVSWAPHTTPKKVGMFAKLSRSNFYDPTSITNARDPFHEQTEETHRRHHTDDVYIYKYNVSPIGFSLRP